MIHRINKSHTHRYLKTYFKNKALQRALILILFVIIAFFIINNGALPTKYKLSVGTISTYDITAPRDIENKLKTKKLAEEAAKKVPSVMKRLDNITIDIIGNVDKLLSAIEQERKDIQTSLQNQKITKNTANYRRIIDTEQAIAANELAKNIQEYKVQLTNQQLKYLVGTINDDELSTFERFSKDTISAAMKKDITENNLTVEISKIQNNFQKSNLSIELKLIGKLIVEAMIKPNSIVDVKLTTNKKLEVYNAAIENKQIIAKGSRIISKSEIITEDEIQVLKELNVLETGKFDYIFALGILALVLILSAMLVTYMKFFCKKIIRERRYLILLGTIIILVLIISRTVYSVSTLLMPIFIAPMLIAILVDIRLAMIVNLLLSVAVSLIAKDNSMFIYVSLIGGTFAAFTVSKATHRSTLSVACMIIAVINALVITCLGIIAKNSLQIIMINCGIVAANGVLSAIFTIGILPIFESIFKIITPLKLLELSNPNQPLIKKLLLEAPGTYHHSLMVGNLAEMATEAIGGNALLARVGAYYHDIGKLKRPNFFKENQMNENPHDKMTPNLSTLVIISHTSDGVDMAEEYKIPQVIKDIISQHHGTTLAAYFYNKAKKADKPEKIKQEDFRYLGPRPSTKESAVVMLADSVEAAVRSMADKTEGKIEGLIRKIIKNKLDDRQLDLCELTLNDMEIISRSFLKVFGGYFHEREVYPETGSKNPYSENKKDDTNMNENEAIEYENEEKNGFYDSF